MLKFECSETEENSLVFQVPPELSKLDLLNWYDAELQFPYFGHNWDSLYDLLSDISWFAERHIWVCHDALPDLSEEDLKIYVNILNDAAANWESNDAHLFHASFPVSNKELLLRLID